ncbi:MAG: YhbY family RNA-binding protein [Thermoanaerobaculia bacterium]
MPLELSSAQRKRLRGLAHDLRPLVHVGKGGLSEAALAQIDREIAEHELIKVRFLSDKEEKRSLAREVESRLHCGLAGLVGHVAVFYRPHAEPKRRKIVLDPPPGAAVREE